MKQIVKIILVAVALSSILNAQNDNDLIPKDKVFYIQSAINYGKDNKGFWDLPGEKDFALNQQFKVWEYNIPEKKNYFQFSTDVDGDRKIKFFTAKNSEYIEMRLAGVNAFVEVYKGDDKNGTNIVINEKNNNSSQNFRFVYVNEGGFKIYNENSKILQLEDQNSNNGSKIVLGDDNDGTHTEWVLISDETRKPLSFPNKPKIESRQEGWADMSGIGRFIVQSVNNYGKNRGGCWDISGNDDPKKGDNIQVWDLSGVAPDRVYSLEEAQNKAYYNIIVGPSLGSDVVVDLHGNKYRNGSNIGTWEPGNSPAQNFYFKHLGGGKFKIYNQNNKILSLDNSSSKNGSNVQIWQDHDAEGTGWYLLDSETLNPFIPYPVPSDLSKIKSGNMPGEESKKLAASIDKTYKEVIKTESRLEALNKKADKARKVLQKTKTASTEINGLNTKVARAYDVIAAFQRLPIIGTPATVLATTLTQVKGKLDKTNTTVKNLEKSMLGPTLNGVYNANEAMYSFERNLVVVSKDIMTAKVNYSSAAACIINSGDQNVTTVFEDKSREANAQLTTVNNSLVEINKNIDELEKLFSSVSNLDGKLKPVEKAIHEIEKAFKAADKVANEINKVLDKRLKKKVLGVGVDISLKDALNVGKKYTKKVTEKINDWVGAALKPVLKKLNIKIPDINIDGLKNELDKLNMVSNELEKQKKEISEKITNVKDLREKLNNSLDGCLSVPPCESNGEVDLNEIYAEKKTESVSQIGKVYNPVFTETTYDFIFNIETKKPLELIRKGDVKTGSGYNGSEEQKFQISHQKDGYYNLFNTSSMNVVTVEDGSFNEGANVVPAAWSSSDNQLFAIVRDTTKYRYAAFLIARHSGMALAVNEKGSVVQKTFNPDDKSQIWAFSKKMAWKNDKGYLGIENSNGAISTTKVGWNYIIHPTLKNAYYIMNAKTYNIFQTEEKYDENNLLASYNLIEAPYKKGTGTSMLFYMNYSDDSRKKVNLIEVFTRYVIDCDAASNLILNPKEKASTSSAWEMVEAPLD